MRIEINTPAMIGKGFTSKREKQADDSEAVVGHLKFDKAIVHREVIDALCGRFPGWAGGAFFDEQGVPYTRCKISLPKLSLTFTGAIRGNNDEDVLTLVEATFGGIEITLCDKGALLAGELAWKVGGDETANCEPLQGRLCLLYGSLRDAEQGDLLKAA
jgi:hypothetical protein